MIFSYIHVRRLGSFLGFKILNFNICRLFRKIDFFFWGGGGGYDLFGVVTKLDYFGVIYIHCLMYR